MLNESKTNENKKKMKTKQKGLSSYNTKNYNRRITEW